MIRRGYPDALLQAEESRHRIAQEAKEGRRRISARVAAGAQRLVFRQWRITLKCGLYNHTIVKHFAEPYEPRGFERCPQCRRVRPIVRTERAS